MHVCLLYKNICTNETHRIMLLFFKFKKKNELKQQKQRQNDDTNRKIQRQHSLWLPFTQSKNPKKVEAHRKYYL